MMYLQVKSRCILGKMLANPSFIDDSFRHLCNCILLYAMENQHKPFFLFLYVSNNLYVGFYIFAIHFAGLEIFSDFLLCFCQQKSQGYTAGAHNTENQEIVSASIRNPPSKNQIHPAYSSIRPTCPVPL